MSSSTSTPAAAAPSASISSVPGLSAPTADEFWAENPAPAWLGEQQQRVAEFVARHASAGVRVALVTSGGTMVPLERNTVRFLDNFSRGTRGAASAESLQAAGYAVIFLHRQYSHEPYKRRLDLAERHPLDLLDVDASGQTVLVSPELQERLAALVRAYKQSQRGGTLLSVSFKTLQDYLYLLRLCSTELAAVGRRGLILAAAAVSDFYLEPAKDKLQSANQGLCLLLRPAPKMLGLIAQWAPDAFLATFKLESDPDLLEKKARQSMASYGQALVIANLLANYRDQVQLFTPGGSPPHLIERLADDEIEPKLIANVTALHAEWLANKA